MTDYAKVTLKVVYSEQPDYGRPVSGIEFDNELTPTMFSHRVFVAAASATTNVWTAAAPSGFSAISGLFVYNRDTSSTLLVAYEPGVFGGTCTISLAPQRYLFTPDVDEADTFSITQSDPTDAIVDIFVLGAV